jgi:uncharacterized SAM-binding protein YcdF (DUF218 family)
MFFLISKILSFLFTPLIWIFTLLIWSKKTNDDIKRKKIFWLALILFYFFSNEFIMDITTGKWEYRYEDKSYLPEKNGPFEYGIVLGGMTWYNTNTTKTQFLRSADRIFQAIWLLKQKKIKKIIFTGGSGSLTSPDIKEGKNIRIWLNQIGIPDSSLIIESQSDNTHQNAVFMKKILDSLNYKNEQLLLITSASHMRRSLACFKKEGISNIIAYPTDYYSSELRFEFDHCFIPSSNAIVGNNVLLHEIIGYVTYKIMGYL